MACPDANTHRDSKLTGFLLKSYKRRITGCRTWKRRFCVISLSRLFYYEGFHSLGTDKTSGVIPLKYFKMVRGSADTTENATKSYVFVLEPKTAAGDIEQHSFAVETRAEMIDWIRCIRECIEDEQSPLCPSYPTNPLLGQPQMNPVVPEASLPPRDSFRSQKSALATCYNTGECDSIPQTETTDTITGVDEKQNEKNENIEKIEKMEKSNANPSFDVDLVAEKPLESVTRNRVRGPSGRRAPAKRNTIFINSRASSLSALNPATNGSSRTSFVSLGTRLSTSTVDQVSINSETCRLQTFAEVEENTFKFGDIDQALFFNSSVPIPEEEEPQAPPTSPPPQPSSNESTKKKKQLSALSFLRKSLRRKKIIKINAEPSGDEPKVKRHSKTDLNRNIAPQTEASSRCVIV